jgi:hypothetical protein
LEVDFDNLQIRQSHEFSLKGLEHVPNSKLGFAGISSYKENSFVTATWDRVCWVDWKAQKVLATVADKRFSDLHGLHVDHDGSVLVANTNLDGIYRIKDSTVTPIWHTWEEKKLRPVLEFVENDYSSSDKHSIPYHHFHVNSILPLDQYLIITCLGPAKPSNLQKLLFKMRLHKIRLVIPRNRYGGIFVLERATKRLVKYFQTEGLHDSVLGKDGLIYATEYFGNAVIALDPHRLTIRRIPLEIEPYSIGGYLTRGLLFENDTFWIGHTVYRGWMKENNVALIRQYQRDGQWTGKEIHLPGFFGIYNIISNQ